MTFKTPVPDSRTIVPGVWEDLMDCWLATFGTSNGEYVQNINNVSPKDFLIEVSKGNIEGHSIVGVTARNPSVGLTFVDLWNANIPQVRPTSNVQMEISSTSANDTLLGSGAQKVLIEYVDEDYVTKTQLAEMDGVTWVQLNIDYLDIQALVVPSDATGITKYNEGTITIRTVIGANIQGQIPFLTDDRGLSVDQDGHYTIPAGKTGFGIDIIPFYPKGEDGYVRSILSTNGGTEYAGATLPFYQSGVAIPIKAPFSLPEKTHIDFQANSTNEAGVEITLISSLLLVDNTQVGTISALSQIGMF